MKTRDLLLACSLLAAAACTKLPHDIPGVQQQLPTTPKTSEDMPTISPPDSWGSDPAADWIGPELDDPDSPGTTQTPSALDAPNAPPAHAAWPQHR
jgi:hypothetical protein